MDKNVAKEFIIDEFSKAMKHYLNNDGAKGNDKLLDYILKTKAWNDTIIYEKTKKGSKILNNKGAVCKAFIEEIQKLNVSSNYHKWLEDVLKYLSKEYFEDKYGMAQKYVNMSIKYLYFLEVAYERKLIDNLSLECFKDSFDVPIDSFILKWLIYNSVNDQEFIDRADEITSWNKMSLDVYPFLEKKVKTLLNETYKETDSILIAESLAWSSIKELKTKVNMEI